jgi:hypothetical protein
MKKLLLFAAVAGLGLVSASPPPKGPDNGPREMRRHYPPCSRTITDRCIQLYERGVRARYERDDEARDDHRRHREAYVMDDRRGDRDDDEMGDHRRHRGDYGMDDRHGLRADYAVYEHRRHRDDDDGDHRWCPEHRAHHGDHHGRAMAEPRPAHRMVMATRIVRVTRVVGCRCTRPARHPVAHRQVAQSVRRAGERG